ncbi:MAG: thiol protease/hemagglutinin PrtT [Tannerella sp.]|jgi:hypothetical protein|nr:thiol protease/hemagglutinin PrtT [Tannerella sp.]
MKKVYFCLLSLLSVTAGYAGKRTQADAAMIAASFYSQHLSLRNAPAVPALTLAYVCTDDDAAPTLRSTADGNACYYIYNIGTGDDEGGFVIVSGDDRADDVLGYATRGRFDIDKIPDNFRTWLSFYQSAMKRLAEMPETPPRTVRAAHNISGKDVLFAQEIKPLLRDMAWGQAAPYNRLCPIIPDSDERAIAGCVATTMAQIMRFHEWPKKGTGTKTYTTEKHHMRLSVDFSQTTYDWAQMRDTYNDGDGYSDEELNAATTLVYHCGVAAEMNYSTVSGASQQIAAFGMKDHFNYAGDMQLLEREFYSTSEWVYILKEELNESRPIFYVGMRDSGAAHAFVCDGYDANGLFHFNWGWMGSGDGYFNVSVIEAWNMFGYNGRQNIVAGIRPAHVKASESGTQLFMPPQQWIAWGNTFARDRKIAFSQKIYHTCTSLFSGKVGIGLYGDGKLIGILHRETITDMRNHGYVHIKDSFSIPETLAAGVYTLCPVFSTDGIRWKHIKSYVMSPADLTVAVDEQSVAIAPAAGYVPGITVAELTPLTEFYVNKNVGEVQVTLSNAGVEETYTSVTFLLLSQTVPVEKYFNETFTGKIVKQEESKFIMLNPGEKKSLVFRPSVEVPAGNYHLYVIEDITGTCLNIRQPAYITVLPEPGLVLTGKMSFPGGNNIHNGDTLAVRIKNTGDDFAGYVFTDIFYRGDATQLVDSLKPQPLGLRKNEETTLKIEFDGQLSDILPGDYTLHISYSFKPSKSGTVFAFTPDEYKYMDISVVNSRPPSGLLPSPETFLFYGQEGNILYIRSDEVIGRLSIFGTDGKLRTSVRPNRAGAVAVPLDRLTPGVYILRSETSGGVRTGKFVKR